MTLTVLTAMIASLANITPAKAQLFPDQSPTREREYDPPPENLITTITNDLLVLIQFREALLYP